ncbi:glycoside hydrolase domain-containing protein [Lentzea sp. JNUCC 0626]|uniref:glycoside hydrolase domain-containing protein n=1 Tax=Lentzea sp. JNUCC 0626 TaxID=3367513 RepID=UPI003749E71D
MEQQILDVQRWVNQTYGDVEGFGRCPEDGVAGPATRFALVRALQHELGITTLVDNFGPGTVGRLDQRGGVKADDENHGIVGILQAGLVCQGYDAGPVTGTFGARTKAAVARLRGDAGLGAAADGSVEPKLVKAVLSLESFVLSGEPSVRSVQQWLNGRYSERRDFFLTGTDGVVSRSLLTALALAIQFELGMSDDVATGTFGPGTRAGLAKNVVGPGDTGVWVRLYSACLVINGYGSFCDLFNAFLVRATVAFQTFAALDLTGRGDFPTWALLLASNGDPDQPAAACDTSTTVTPERARALHSAGYRVVGRYLDERPSARPLDKQIKQGELRTLFAHGLKVFAISQYDGSSAGYFTEQQGRKDAQDAHAAALGHGFGEDTVIFFAVDYDATGEEIDSNVVPYFRGVVAGLAESGGRYRHGVYGSRNVCSQVSERTGARWSFISGMSTGYSGNMGFPLPSNWAYNQVQTLPVGEGDGQIDIDKNTSRPGTDAAVSFVEDETGKASVR